MLVLKTRSQKLERTLFAPDGQGLAAAGQRGVYWWRSALDDRKPARLGDAECSGIGFTPDGAYLIAALGRTRTHLSVIGLDGQGVQQVGLRGYAPTVAVCPSTGLAVTETWSGGEMIGWRVGPGGSIRRAWVVDAEPGSIGSSVAFAPDGSWFVRAARNPSPPPEYRLVIHDPATGKETRSCRGDDWVSSGPTVSPDKKWIAFANGSLLCAQSVKDPRRRASAVNDNTHQYTGLAFHPSGRLLAATNNDKTVKVIDTATWRLTRTYAWDIGRMRSVAFSPDGLLAAAGSDTGKVVIWDVDE
jgi:WD domain, G-beta repeat